jgi:copper chaperone
MSNERATVLEVQGMTCPSCIRHVSEALKEVDGVAAVEVELRAGIAIVQHDADEAPIDRLIDALSEAGYASRPRRDAAV